MTDDGERHDRAGSAADGSADEPLLVDHRGRPIEIPPEGTLWSLALGWRAVLAWRRARKRAGVEPTDHLVYQAPAPEDRS